MEEIRIYHSLWKNGLLILVCFAFAGLGVHSLIVHPEKSGIVFWLGLLFFGLGGLFMLWLILRERITDKPYYVVTDESVIMNSGLKAWEIRFADVKSFFLMGKMIGIRYKKDIEAGTTIEEVEDGISMRKKTLLNPGEPYDIYVTDLSKKPKDILNLLNQRLKD